MNVSNECNKLCHLIFIMCFAVIISSHVPKIPTLFDWTMVLVILFYRENTDMKLLTIGYLIKYQKKYFLYKYNYKLVIHISKNEVSQVLNLFGKLNLSENK